MTTDNKRKFQVTFLLILCSFFASHLSFWLLPNVLEIWNSQATDQLFALRSSSEKLRPPYDDTVVHVDLNNSTIKRLGNFYLNRSHFAQVVRNLASMGVAAQVYDFIFVSPLHEESDAALIQATKEAGHVFFGAAFDLWKEEQQKGKEARQEESIPYLHRTKWFIEVDGDTGPFYIGRNPLVTFTDLASAANGLGSLSIKFDRDGVLRRVPLLVRYEDAFYPLLPFRVICHYLGVHPDNILVKAGKRIILKKALKPGESKSYDLVIPIDRSGNMIVNYIGPWEQMHHYNFADIFLASNDRVEMEWWREELKGKIVVISDVSTGSADAGPVPTDSTYPFSGVQANIINGILTDSFLRLLSGWQMLLIEVLLLTMLFALSTWLSPLYFSVSSLLLAASYIGAAGVGFFYSGIIFHIIRPLLMVFFAVISLVIYRYIHEEKEKMESVRQRDYIRETFGRYLSNEVVDELLGSPEGLKMSGEIREVTFLVSDLRGFTSLTMKLPPRQIISIINRYLECMVKIITDYHGTVNEIQGDGILVFFGAPLFADDGPDRAIACAIEMQNAMPKFNEVQQRLGLPKLAMGIGINTGEVVVGNLGSEKRAKYGAIGGPINMAFRIESYTIGGQILISPTTYKEVESIIRVGNTMEVQFKGIEYPVTLYEVVGIRGKYQLSLPKKEVGAFERLEAPIPFTCFQIKDKAVSDVGISGHITEFGNSGAEVRIEQRVEVFSNLKILLESKEDAGLAEVYAKVVSVEPEVGGSPHFLARLEFTWLPEEVRTYLVKKCSQKGGRH